MVAVTIWTYAVWDNYECDGDKIDLSTRPGAYDNFTRITAGNNKALIDYFHDIFANPNVSIIHQLPFDGYTWYYKQLNRIGFRKPTITCGLRPDLRITREVWQAFLNRESSMANLLSKYLELPDEAIENIVVHMFQ